MIAIDTETTLIQDRDTHRTATGRTVNTSPWEVPELVCLSYHDHRGRCGVIPRSEVQDFIARTLASGEDIIFHNAAFDFWVIERVLNAPLADEGDRLSRRTASMTP